MTALVPLRSIFVEATTEVPAAAKGNIQAVSAESEGAGPKYPAERCESAIRTTSIRFEL